MTEETTMLRVNNKLLEEAKKTFPYMKGLTSTALVEALIRMALETKK